MAVKTCAVMQIDGGFIFGVLRFNVCSRCWWSRIQTQIQAKNFKLVEGKHKALIKLKHLQGCVHKLKFRSDKTFNRYFFSQ